MTGDLLCHTLQGVSLSACVTHSNVARTNQLDRFRWCQALPQYRTSHNSNIAMKAVLSQCQSRCHEADSVYATTAQPTHFMKSSLLNVGHQSQCLLHRRDVKCLASEADTSASSSEGGAPEGLQIGTPIVIVEAPPFVKSAEPMPMLRENKGQIKAGDVGRIMDRRPKGVWAIRFTSGAFLVDRKYFNELET